MKVIAKDRLVSVVMKGARDAARRALVNIVRDELEKVRRDCNPSATEQFVDGVEDKPIEQIERKALFLFSYWREIADFAIEVLKVLSPVEEGDYQSSHTIFADGVQVDSGDIGAAEKVVITNTVPYARRLELASTWWYKNSGKRGEPRGWSVQDQVPQPADSIYQHAAATVRRRYGNVVIVSYGWVEVEGGNGRTPAILMEKA